MSCLGRGLRSLSAFLVIIIRHMWSSFSCCLNTPMYEMPYCLCSLQSYLLCSHKKIFSHPLSADRVLQSHPLPAAIQRDSPVHVWNKCFQTSLCLYRKNSCDLVAALLLYGHQESIINWVLTSLKRMQSGSVSHQALRRAKTDVHMTQQRDTLASL